MKARRAGIAVCLLCLWSARAHAQSAELALILPDCPGREAWRREVRELFALELPVDLASRAADPELPVLSVEQACTLPSADARLRFHDPRTGMDQTRVLGLRDVPPELRARVLALALAELLRSRWLTEAEGSPASTQPSAAEPPATTAPPPAQVQERARDPESAPLQQHHVQRVAPAAPAPMFTLALGPTLNVYFARGSLLYGVELSFSWWRFELGVLGSLGTNGDAALGRAYYRRVHGFASFDVARFAMHAWTWAAAVRGALGGSFASAEGQRNVSSAQASDLSCDGSLETWLGLHVADAWAAKLRVNVGYAFGPRYLAQSRVLADFSGLFLGLALDLTWAK